MLYKVQLVLYKDKNGLILNLNGLLKECKNMDMEELKLLARHLDINLYQLLIVKLVINGLLQNNDKESNKR